MAKARAGHTRADPHPRKGSGLVSVDGSILEYTHKMAGHLWEASRLDGLEGLVESGRAPARLLWRIEKVMRLFDDFVRYVLGKCRKKGLTISCRLECDHCCYQMPSGLSAMEILFLYNGIRESDDSWRFFKRCLESQESWAENMRICGNNGAKRPKSDEALMMFHVKRNPCPLLRDSLCQAYPFRPFPCRGHFAVTPRHWCDPAHFQFPYARAMNVIPGQAFHEAMRQLNERLNLGVSDVLACGLLEFTVNVMRFERIQWIS